MSDNIYTKRFIGATHEITLVQNFTAGVHAVVSRAINKRTGRGWQARTYIIHTTNGMEALAAFNRAVKEG